MSSTASCRNLPPNALECAPEIPSHNIPTEEASGNEVSIFEYYSIPNELAEVDRCRRDGLSKEVVASYVHENAVRFALEFAGMISHVSLEYRLDGQELSYVARDGELIRMRDSYEGNAIEHGPDSREHQEFVGYSICENALAQGATSTTIISPPHEQAAAFAGDGYGLVMSMIRSEEDPQKIHLHILRYAEQAGSLEQTNKIAHALQRTYMTIRGPLETQDDMESVYATQADCRMNPFVSQSENPTADFALIARAVGAAPEQLRFSNLYEAKLRRDLEPFIEQYKKAIMSGDSPRAKKALSEFFNAAKDLKFQLKQQLTQQEQPTYRRITQAPTTALGRSITPDDERILSMQMVHYGDTRYQKEAVTQGGGSCPVSSSGGGASAFGVDAGIRAGLTIERAVRGFGATEGTSTHYEDYSCPNPQCGKTLSGEKKGDKDSWRKECEHCGAKLGC